MSDVSQEWGAARGLPEFARGFTTPMNRGYWRRKHTKALHQRVVSDTSHLGHTFVGSIPTMNPPFAVPPFSGGTHGLGD